MILFGVFHAECFVLSLGFDHVKVFAYDQLHVDVSIPMKLGNEIRTLLILIIPYTDFIRFCEGFYLHRLITAAFAEESSFSVFYFIGWGNYLATITIFNYFNYYSLFFSASAHSYRNLRIHSIYSVCPENTLIEGLAGFSIFLYDVFFFIV